jgi:hypothetical protein
LSRGINVCVVCRGDCVDPISWDEAGEDRWRVLLRCGLRRDLIDAGDSGINPRSTLP